MATWRMISHLPPRRPFSRLSLSCRSSRGIVPARSGKTLIISYYGFYLALILCCVPPLLLFSLGFKTILFIFSYRPLHRKYTYSTDERTKRVVPTAKVIRLIASTFARRAPFIPRFYTDQDAAVIELPAKGVVKHALHE